MARLLAFIAVAPLPGQQSEKSKPSPRSGVLTSARSLFVDPFPRHFRNLKPFYISSRTLQNRSNQSLMCLTGLQAVKGAVVAPPQTILAWTSAIVGALVVAGSVMYKIPQVLRIARRKSGEGVSVTMYALETLGVSFSALYFARKAFSFSTYGELLFVMLQNVVILGLIARYEKLSRRICFAATIGFPVLVAVLALPSVPLSVLMTLQVASIPILNSARIPQIALNWRRKSTGELSCVTLVLQLVGNLARIFTTLASVRDPLMLVGVCVSTLFNSALVVQWLHYSSKKTPTDAKAAAEIF
jgi:mannose-P-dolichol utilization defect 1